MRRRALTAIGIAAGLLVAAVVAYVAYSSLIGPINVLPNTSLAPGNCSPRPCADVQGFTLWVSGVQADAGLVRMQLKFKNSSVSTHASPEDLQLIDGNGRSSGLVTSAAGCSTWARHEFSGGATFGPVDVCFHTTSSTAPLTLRWSPDFGLFCCQTDIKIPQT